MSRIFETLCKANQCDKGTKFLSNSSVSIVSNAVCDHSNCLQIFYYKTEIYYLHEIALFIKPLRKY